MLPDYVIGVSAGIAYGASYVSEQRSHRNLDIMVNYINDKQYMGFGSPAAHLDFVFGTIPTS